MFSPSNSGWLRNIGDVVTLRRNPNEEVVAFQTHGDADGAELVFEGSTGAGWLPLEAKASPDPMPLHANGFYSHVVDAKGLTLVQVRLANISHGNVHVAMHSGMADMMKTVAAVQASGDGKPAKPVKLTRAAMAPGAGPAYRIVPSNGQFYVLDEVSGRASPPHKSDVDALAWITQQKPAAPPQQPAKPNKGAPAAAQATA